MYLGLANRLTRAQSETPALTLDLMRATLDSRLTFSRASAATDIIGGVLTLFASDAARTSIQNGLLIEPQATNLAYGNSITSGGNCTVTGGQSDPLAGTAAFLVTESSGTFTCYSSANSVTPAADTKYSVSAFVKAGTCDRVQLFTSSSYSGFTAYANFYLNGAGSVLAVGAGVVNASILSLAGGWYRVSYQLTSVASPGSGTTCAFSPLVTGVEGRLPSILASGRTFYIYGPQFEAGETTTSYIPTSSAAATRAADVCTGPVSWINEAEGTLLVQAVPLSEDVSLATSPRAFCLHNAGGTSYHEVRRLTSDTSAQGAVTTAGVNQATLGATAWPVSTAAKTALAWKVNDMAFCFAGGTVQTDNSAPNGLPSGLSVFRLGANSATGGFWNGYLRLIKGWTRRLSDSQIKGVTQ